MKRERNSARGGGGGHRGGSCARERLALEGRKHLVGGGRGLVEMDCKRGKCGFERDSGGGKSAVARVLRGEGYLDKKETE